MRAGPSGGAAGADRGPRYATGREAVRRGLLGWFVETGCAEFDAGSRHRFAVHAVAYVARRRGGSER